MDVKTNSKFVSMILVFVFFSLVFGISVGAVGLSYSDKDIEGVMGTNISYPIWISNAKDSSVDVNYHYDFQGHTVEEIYTVEANSNRKVVQIIQVPGETGEYNPYFEISVSGGEGGTSSISTRVILTVNLQAVEETTTTTSSTTTTTSSTTTTTTVSSTTTTQPSTTTTTSDSGSSGSGDTTTTTQEFEQYRKPNITSLDFSSGLIFYNITNSGDHISLIDVYLNCSEGIEFSPNERGYTVGPGRYISGNFSLSVDVNKTVDGVCNIYAENEGYKVNDSLGVSIEFQGDGVNESTTTTIEDVNSVRGEDGFPWDYVIGGVVIVGFLIVLVYYKFFHTKKIRF